VESATVNFGGVDEATGTLHLQLHTKDETPPGMVWLPPGFSTFARVAVRLPRAPTTPVWIDKYEVSNRQFKAFVDAAGYQKREYWKQPFIRNGREVSWEEAIAAFRDTTPRPGPATWEAGTYPDGKADFPVGGVSWYEASAYAEFAGKSLPTVSHWYLAAGLGPSSQITSLSNFGGQGPAQVGSHLGLAPSGTYDMAGNVKQWTVNASAENRFILGGSWNNLSYMFQQADARPPFERDPSFGFRCVRHVEPVPDTLTGPLATVVVDRSRARPVDDQTFRVFTSLLSYDKTDVKASVDSVTDAPHWRRENVSFDAAYGNEKVILHLYLPKDTTPPYQPVLYFGGANMLMARTPDQVSSRAMEYIVKSGRAVVLPAYAGTLERGPTPLGLPPARQRDLTIMQLKDAFRSIDYLETRKDIDTSRIGFYGVSLGGGVGTIALGAEPRFKAAVLASIGALDANAALLPEVDIWNYAPRVKVPVLMLNGKDDSQFPVEASQTPFFEALGTPDKDKRHIVFTGGHVDFLDRLEVIREALDWLDRYLGPVKK
jgi:dienelactone hydrolase